MRLYSRDNQRPESTKINIRRFMANITVLGLGYIGLPTAIALANAGHNVSGFDINPNMNQSLKDGSNSALSHEPDLSNAFDEAVSSGNFKVVRNPIPADVYIICVPTPVIITRSATPKPCLEALHMALGSIKPLLKNDDLIIVESTVPVGSCQALGEEVRAERSGINVHIAYCPERVLPGNILLELKTNSRIIGGLSPDASNRAEIIYRSFVEGSIRLTDAKTAELCKLAENSFRDVNIAFANELASIAERNDVDPWQLIKLANEHPRVNILSPGPGVGGHCIAVDPWFLVSGYPEQTKLIKTARAVNSEKPEKVARQVITMARQLSAQTVACLGLTYKPDVTDTRDSPACQIASLLQAAGLKVISVEPNLTEHPEYPLVTLEEALAHADLAVALVKHSAFLTAEALANWSKPIFDTCGLLQTS